MCVHFHIITPGKFPNIKKKSGQWQQSMGEFTFGAGIIHGTIYVLSNPFLANAPILHPLKTLKNQRFSGVFRGYNMGTTAKNGLKF